MDMDWGRNDYECKLSPFIWKPPIPYVELVNGETEYTFQLYPPKDQENHTHMYLHILRFKRSIEESGYPNPSKAMFELFPSTLAVDHYHRWNKYCEEKREGGNILCTEEDFDIAVAESIFAFMGISIFDAMKFKHDILCGQRFNAETSVRDMVVCLTTMSDSLSFVTTDERIGPLNTLEIKFAILARLDLKFSSLFPKSFFDNSLTMPLDALVQELEGFGVGGKCHKCKRLYEYLIEGDSSDEEGKAYEPDVSRQKKG